ncbi:MAG: hypothetical protein AVO35_11980 [Candidatus Aegiribacteria sp. MLS_C]|nr:MAG: hypothetical protein AVO35_11980 [Candidatus Aegiribacteria sp. MLS_C]
MRTREPVFWWTIIALCLVSPLIRLVFPQKASLLLYPAQFSFGVMASIATGFTIVHFSSERRRVHIRVALVFSLILAVVLIWLAGTGSFDRGGGWVLLPILFLGPLLLLRGREKDSDDGD